MFVVPYACPHLYPPIPLSPYSGHLHTHPHPTNIQNNQTPCTTYPLKNPHNQNFSNPIVGVYHYHLVLVAHYLTNQVAGSLQSLTPPAFMLRICT